MDCEKNVWKRSSELKKFRNIMICEKCESEQISVLNTRMTQGIKRRRRVCLECGFRTTTYEIAKEDIESVLSAKILMGE